MCSAYFAAIAVSKDHKPDQTDERQRIEDTGGFVMWPGTPVIVFSSSSMEYDSSPNVHSLFYRNMAC
jgi:serine/threonine protein phosphatase PrpC